MSTKQINDELIDLVQQTREYVRYFGELGAETIAVNEVQETRSSATPASPQAAIAQGASSKAADTRQTAATLPSRTAPRRPTRSAPPDSLFADLATAEITPPQSTETLEEIWSDIGDCTRCGLCAGRTQVVNTHGNRKARLMFVGEAPGADEDAQGKPFVGRAGQLLTKMIEAMGMKREDVIIGNVNRCRPPGNRQPTLEEAAICRPFLFREIAAVQPEVIVVMGNTALRNLLEVREGITRVRGHFQDFRGIKVMPTFHPAYLLRDPSKKRETWDDLKKVMDYLDSNSRKSSD
jgi:uracil-DNA glycosylase family 4